MKHSCSKSTACNALIILPRVYIQIAFDFTLSNPDFACLVNIDMAFSRQFQRVKRI